MSQLINQSIISIIYRHLEDSYLEKFQSIDKNASLQKANEEKAIGHDDDAILSYILGQDYFNVIYYFNNFNLLSTY